jgi:hypothetical protein
LGRSFFIELRKYLFYYLKKGVFMKVYGFPVFSYLCFDGQLLITGGLYDENGKFLVSVNEYGLIMFEHRVKEMCKVRNYDVEYCKQAPQWLIKKIKALEIKENQHE